MNLVQVTGSQSLRRSGSLALATSLIHRSRSLGELRRAFFGTAPRFVHANAFGMYLFDEDRNTETIFYYQANQKFLSEYEHVRTQDPLFKCLLKKRKFAHSLGIFESSEWHRQPLHEFLVQWGLEYSIQAPLCLDGKLKGTLNIARSGKKYFEPDCLAAAQFLCNEIDAAFQRICETETLKRELWRNATAPALAKRVSKREREVLELAVAGLANRVIAFRLGISENTVRHHLKRIYRVYRVHNRAQLAQRFYAGCSKPDESAV